MRHTFALLVLGLSVHTASIGCSEEGTAPERQDSTKDPSSQGLGPMGSRGQKHEIEVKRSQLGNGVWLEPKNNKRRVVVEATVCLREGQYGLECLLCRTGTKEHESVLHTSADAKVIHAGLLAAGATPGSPVQYKDMGKEIVTIPPSGQPIRVNVEYESQGRRISVSAQDWVRNSKSGLAMKEQWIFAGSRLWQSQTTGKTVYGASAEGGYICTSNVPTALLDVPFDSPKSLEGRSFEPFTEHIPPIDTKVMLILEPVSVRNATKTAGKPAPSKSTPNP